MSVSYKAVGWNPFKKKFDLFLTLGIVVFVLLFVAVTMALFPKATPEIVMIRAFGIAGLLLLHFILAVGPLARLDRRWLPVLYNRRHLGVTMFLLGLIHAVLAVATYHLGGDANPIVSIFTVDAGKSLAEFPFQVLGFFALMILFVMAATSHDFWLANLTAPVWKTLHMLVYVAYGLLVAHVALGILQSETSPILVGFLVLGFVVIAGLHLYTGFSGRGIDTPISSDLEADGFVEVCLVDDVPVDAAHGVSVSGERVAIVNWEGKLSAISGVCQHQNGPLAEGKFTKGCLTCPWHGYQYNPDCGKSPEPFTEEVPTFNIRVSEGRVFIHPKPNPAGTFVEPVVL